MPYIIKNGKTYTGNSVTLTQAQYDALSEAEKNNGIAYYIYDSDAVLDASDVGLGTGSVETLAGSVAVIETSPATAVHAEGSYILWNGQLYTVISAIDVGQSLTVGSNITATSAGSEISALKAGLTYKDWFNWVSYLSAQEQDTNALCRGQVTKNTVSLTIRTKSRTHAENDVIMTIPEGYRPISDIHAVAKMGSNDVCVLLISPNGSVTIWSAPTGTSSGRLVSQFTYVY